MVGEPLAKLIAGSRLALLLERHPSGISVILYDYNLKEEARFDLLASLLERLLKGVSMT